MPSEDNKGFDTSTFGKKMFEKKSREMLAPDLDVYEPQPPSLEDTFGKDFLKQRTMDIIQETMKDTPPMSFISPEQKVIMGSELERLKKMQQMNGTTFDNGERSQGDQEAEQRADQNNKTSLANRTAAFLNIFGQ